QRTHVTEMRDRNADLADLSLGAGMIAVVSGLGGQIESNRKPGLPFGKIFTVERVRFPRRRMPGIGTENPGFVALPTHDLGGLPASLLSTPDESDNEQQHNRTNDGIDD